MRKAYAYIRMSTKSQLDGDSRTRQEKLIKEYVLEHKLDLINLFKGKPFEDIGVSGFRGKNSKKGVLASFLAAVKDQEIEKGSVLLIESFDRLSRDNLLDALDPFTTIINNGIEIVTLLDKQSFTKERLNKEPYALFGSLCVMIRANEESEIKSSRISSSWLSKRANIKSKILTKNCPAWLEYSDENEKFEIIEERGEVVKMIFDKCINSYGLFSIARYLNENKVPTFGRGEIWHISFLRKMIVNRSVIGEFHPHMMIDGKRQKTDDAISNYFPKVIDENTYLLAQRSLFNRKFNGKGRKGTSFTNIFSGLTYCGSCGSKMMLRNRGGINLSSKKLACGNHLVSGGCQMSEWTLADFETIIIRHLKEVNFTDLINIQDDKIMSLDDQKLALIEKLETNKLKSDRAMDLTINSDLTTEIKESFLSKIRNLFIESKDIKSQIDDISKQIMDKIENETVFSSMALKDMIEELKNRQDDYEFRSSVNTFLTHLIKKIEVIDSSAVFQPWDLDENDLNEDSPIVKSYRLTSKVKLTRSLEEIVSSDDFKQFYRLYHREICIHYQTGVVRNILYGANSSSDNAKMLEIYKKAKVKSDTSTVVTDAKDTVITAID